MIDRIIFSTTDGGLSAVFEAITYASERLMKDLEWIFDRKYSDTELGKGVWHGQTKLVADTGNAVIIYRSQFGATIFRVNNAKVNDVHTVVVTFEPRWWKLALVIACKAELMGLDERYKAYAGPFEIDRLELLSLIEQEATADANCADGSTSSATTSTPPTGDFFSEPPHSADIAVIATTCTAVALAADADTATHMASAATADTDTTAEPRATPAEFLEEGLTTLRGIMDPAISAKAILLMEGRKSLSQATKKPISA